MKRRFCFLLEEASREAKTMALSVTFRQKAAWFPLDQSAEGVGRFHGIVFNGFIGLMSLFMSVKLIYFLFSFIAAGACVPAFPAYFLISIPKVRRQKSEVKRRFAGGRF